MAGTIVQDLNPGVQHQVKATFTPGKSKAPAPPPQPVLAPLPPKGVVQRVARQLDTAGQLDEPDGFAELEADLLGTAQPETPAPATEPDDLDVSTILQRFKGSPDEIAKQLAKSYSESEKRMRKMEQERQLLLKQGMQPVQPQPVQPVVQPNQQMQVVPTFDYKKAGDKFLDAPDQHLKSLAEHIQGSAEQKLFEVAAPIYEELIDARLFRKYPDVVTEENLDVIKAMAHTAPGANRWEKIVSAVKSYQASVPTMNTPKQNPEVQAMQQAAQTPSPQARTSGEKKMYKQSYIQSLMDQKIRTGEYQRDPKWRNLIDTAYREGRVIRGQ